MKEMERLTALLFPEKNDGSRVIDLKFFPGERQVTVEEFCEDAHAAFVQVDSGQSIKSVGFAEELNPISVERFLAVA